MRRFYTADHHFGHANIIGMAGRPWPDIGAHDEALIARWNEVVGPDDEVWHLGDFANKCHGKRLREIFGSLNGHKKLVPGNHDHDETLALPWASPPTPYVELWETTGGGKTKVVLHHYAYRVWNGMWRGSVNLYGHSHGNLEGLGNACDVGVDCWDYRPVTFAQILARIATQPPIVPKSMVADA